MEANRQTIISLPNNASIHAMRSYLAANEFFPTAPSSLVLRFNPRFSFMQPFVAAMLAAWGHYWSKKAVPIACENVNVRGIDYATRMRLFDYLPEDPGRGVREHESSGRFIPITKLESSDDVRQFVTDVIPMLHSSSADHVDAVAYCLSELTRNVIEHAGRTPAFACAQYYERPGKVSIGVADCGIGVRASLSSSYSFSSDADAIIAAMRPGVSGSTPVMYGSPENAGAGLFFTKSIAYLSGGYFSLHSGSAAYRLRRRAANSGSIPNIEPTDDRHDIYAALPYWQGTVVAVDIESNPSVAFEAVMKQIREAYAGPRKGRPRPRFGSHEQRPRLYLSACR